MAADQRQGEAEAGALAGLAPRLQPALVQPGVLDADRQAEAGAAGAADPRRVGAPEPAEHQLLLAGPQPDAVVADGDGHGVLVDAHPDPHRFALGVVDGVGDQVAQDALHPAGVDLGDDLLVRHVDDEVDLGVAREVADVVQRALHGVAQVDRLDGQLRDARVVAGDLQQVVEQQFEAVEFTDHQLGRAAQRRVEILAVVVDQVGGHPHRRQRGAQLVADVGGEPALQVAELLELGDLARQAFGHVVERHRQPRHVVLAAHRHALGQMAFGEAFGDPRRRPHRQHDLARDDQRDGGQHEQQHHAAGDHRAAHQRDGGFSHCSAGRSGTARGW